MSRKLIPVGVRIWFRISVRIRAGGVFLGGNFPRTDWGEWISFPIFFFVSPSLDI